MSTASRILDDQVIHVKRGRSNSFGFEPAWNAYFDFYLSTKYFNDSLLELEDVTFHLFLRKNINDRNPDWKMPTIRQIKKKFGIGQAKIEAMLARLEAAHLLEKVSGVGKGEDGQNIGNDYLLSDPIPTLNEFLTVAAAGAFGRPLNAAYHPTIAEAESASEPEPSCTQTEYTTCTQDEYTPVPAVSTPPVPEPGTDQQTSKKKQTPEQAKNPIWENVLEALKLQMHTGTFSRFVEGTMLTEINDGTAIITTPQAYMRDWLENRLSGPIGQLLTAASGVSVTSIRCVCRAT